MVVDTKVNTTVANCSNRRSDGKRNPIEDSDEDEDQFVCCYDDERNECEAVNIQTIEKFRNILTPPRSKKRIIVDTPDTSSNYVEKEKDNQHKNINVVKALYNDCNDILELYHDKDFAQPLPEDERLKYQLLKTVTIVTIKTYPHQH